MTRLSVNLNKIAVLRNSRGGTRPDPLAAARVVLAAGAAGLTVHPRPDQRHIRATDVRDLAALLDSHRSRSSHGARVELNIEGNPFAAATAGGYPGLLSLAEALRPDQLTLVPDSDRQLTSDHGFDLARDGARLQPLIARARALGIRVSLFMDSDSAHIERAAALGAERIELYTGPYAEAFARGDHRAELDRCVAAADRAVTAGLAVNAGHDLDQANLPALLAAIPTIAEVSIGHALIDDALYAGLDATVRRYLAICAAVPT